jgi:hypothetical protein
MPIEWHEQCIINQKLYLKRKESELLHLENEVNALSDNIFYYEKQIERAKKLNKHGFDSERFMAGFK